MCTILVVHLVVIAISVIVALTKYKRQVKYYMLPVWAFGFVLFVVFVIVVLTENKVQVK